jgi:CRP/FNR family transcriptional regulator
MHVFNEADLNELNKSKQVMTYKKGQSIFIEGSNSHGLYCLHKGKIKIHKLGNSGREQIVRFAKSGDVVGYRAFINGEKYYATATAMEDSEVCFFPYSSIFDKVKNNPDFLREMLKLVSNDLKQSEDKITHLTQNYVNQRIAEAILWIKNTFGYQEDNKTINANLTRSELAGIAGTSTETTIRVLSEFQKDKLIELKGKSISILNENQLKAISELPY